MNSIFITALVLGIALAVVGICVLILVRSTVFNLRSKIECFLSVGSSMAILGKDTLKLLKSFSHREKR